MDRREAFERALPLVAGRTALLVVDMQRAFLEPGEAMEVPPARDVVPRIGELIAIFRDKGLPVVFTRFTYSAEAPLLVGELHPEHRPATPGTPVGGGGRHHRASRGRTMSPSSPTSSPARASSSSTSATTTASTAPCSTAPSARGASRRWW